MVSEKTIPSSMYGPIALAIAIVSSFLLSGTTYGEFVILTIVVYIASICILSRNEIPYSHLHISIYLFIIYIAINPFWSINFDVSIFHILVICQIPLLFLLFSTDKIQKSWRNYLLIIPIPALISSIWGIVEYILTDQRYFFIRNHRIDGFLVDPNSFAAMQYIFSILLFSLLYIHPPDKPLILRGIWLIQFLVLSALLLTLSRSGMVIWLLFIAIIYIYSHVKKIKKLKKYVALHLIIALVSYIFIQVLIAQVDQPLVRDDLPENGVLSTSLNGRLEIWKPMISLITERPLFGWGLKTYASLYPSIRKEYGSSGNVAHNDYIQFTLEGGIVLLLFLLMFLGFHLYLFINLLTHKASKIDTAAGVELALMLLANLALLLHSTTNFSFYIIQLCILSGIIFARSYYLSVTIGLIKQPSYICFTKRTRIALILLLTIVTTSILYKAISSFLFIAPERYSLTNSLSTNISLLNIFTAITPLDNASSSRLVTVLSSHMKTVSDPQRKKQLLDYTISILQPLVEEYPYLEVNYHNLGILLQSAYLQFPNHKEDYKHYPDLWMKSIIINPRYISSYLKLYDDFTSKKQYRQALTVLERIVPWITDGKLSRKNVLLIQELLIKLAEKTDDDLLPLYRKLSLSAEQSDIKAYFDTYYEINRRLESRQISSEEKTQLITLPTASQSQLSLPPGEG